MDAFNFNLKNRKKLTLAIVIGFISIFIHFSYWFQNDRLSNTINFAIAFVTALYLIPQAIFVWLIYLKAKLKKTPIKKFVGKVDIFVPAYDEPLWLLERILISVKNYKYPSEVFLLDDGRKEERKQLCQKMGINYITRENNNGYKAGNINHALKYSKSDFIAVFDSDHISSPDYLYYAMSYFENEKIGAVQVILDHYNENESFVSKGSAELNDSFFSATMLGMEEWKGAVIFGSNSIFRKKALESIGGYKIGLAEDLRTSIYLHANGWETAYVPEILAKGLTPSDLTSYYKQQFKWSRGVFSALLNDYPKLFLKLKFNHHICYATRMTYYLSGFIVLGSVIATIYSFLSETFAKNFSEYLIYSAPLVLSFFTAHALAGNSFKIKKEKKFFSVNGMLLALGTYPIYCLSFILEMARLKWNFIPTPKEKGQDKITIIIPQLIFATMLLYSMIYRIVLGSDLFYLSIILFSIVLLIIHFAVFYAFFENRFAIKNKKFDIQKESLNYLREFQIV